MADTLGRDPFGEFSDSNPAQAGRSHQLLRSKLIFYFFHRGMRDPENMADDVIARAWRRYTGGAPIDELLNYCYGIAGNVIKEVQKRPPDAQLVVSTLELVPQTTDAVAEYENDLVLSECLGRLPVHDRDTLLEYYRGDRTELCEKLGISANALRIRVSRSLDKIRTSLGLDG